MYCWYAQQCDMVELDLIVNACHLLFSCSITPLSKVMHVTTGGGHLAKEHLQVDMGNLTQNLLSESQTN